MKNYSPVVFHVVAVNGSDANYNLITSINPGWANGAQWII